MGWLLVPEVTFGLPELPAGQLVACRARCLTYPPSMARITVGWRIFAARISHHSAGLCDAVDAEDPIEFRGGRPSGTFLIQVTAALVQPGPAPPAP